MSTSISSIATVCLIILNLFLASCVKKILWTEDAEARKQMVVLIAIDITAFMTLVVYNYTTQSFPREIPFAAKAVMCALYAFMVICLFLKLTRHVFKLNTIPVMKETARAILRIVIVQWAMFFTMLAVINYMMIMLFPHQFSGVQDLTFAETAFETVYYTFGLMITYSGGAVITAKGMLVKGMEMVEILFFYIVIGMIVTNIISKASEQPAVSTENRKKRKK